MSDISTRWENETPTDIREMMTRKLFRVVGQVSEIALLLMDSACTETTMLSVTQLLGTVNTDLKMIGSGATRIVDWLNAQAAKEHDAKLLELLDKARGTRTGEAPK